MLDTLQSLLALCAIALAAWGLGRPLARWLRIGQEDRLATVVWSFALGLVFAGLGLTVWGLLGGLSAPAIRWATMAAAGLGGMEILRGFGRSSTFEVRRWTLDVGRSSNSTNTRCEHRTSNVQRPTPNDRAAATPWRTPLFAAAAWCICISAAGGSLVSALAPAVAGDALCYHLELPKVFLSRGAIEFLPLHENSTFPLLAEMWYLWALALDSAVTAQLIHWGLGLLLAGASVLLARPILGCRAAWLVGVVVLVVPGVTNQMTAPLNDVALAAFCTLALVAWQAARVAGPLDRWRWFALAGTMAGAALSIKYVAILFAAAVGATCCWSLVRSAPQRRPLLRGAAIVVGVATLVGGAWYARATYYRGNPVYPFFARWIGGETPPPAQADKTPLRWNARDALSAPWQVTMQPERFGGRGHQLGGLFLIALPAVLLVRNGPLRGLLAVAAIYALLWYVLRQNVRFLLPIVPILASATAAVLIDLRRWPAIPRAVGGLSCAAVIALGAVIPLHRARPHVAVALGLESRAAFLARSEPTYRAAQFVNEQLSPGARILSEDFRGFYVEREFTRENAFRRATNYAHRLESPEALACALRAAGFTHLLLAEAEGPTAPNNATLSRCVEAAQTVDPRPLSTLLAYSFRDTSGVVRRYRLVELRNDTAKGPHGRRMARASTPGPR